VYIADIPEEKAAQYGTPEKIVLSSKFQASTLNHNKMTVEEICLYVGWNKGGME
jgi:hypothetical protein